MPENTFDIASKIDLNEVLNAVQQTSKEIGTRYDLKDSKSSVELNEKDHKILLASSDEYKLKAVTEILGQKLVKRNVPLKGLQYGTVSSASSGSVRQEIVLQQGISTGKGERHRESDQRQQTEGPGEHSGRRRSRERERSRRPAASNRLTARQRFRYRRAVHQLPVELMPRRIESLFLTGPDGRLEALLEEPELGSPVEGAVVCHPHPQGGGTMHNKVVYRLARALRKSGCAVLRFNYRGVNLSEGKYAGGIGETEDARAVLRELATRYPELPLLAAGFSFGSRVALRLSSTEPGIRRVIAVGFPARLPQNDFVFGVKVPKYFIQSTQDEFGPEPEMQAFYASLPEPKQIDWIPAEDHFFRNGLDPYEAAVERIGRDRAPGAFAQLQSDQASSTLAD